MKHGNFSWKSGEFWTGERWDECENRFFARFPESICYLIILPCQKYGCEWPMINGLNMIAPLEWFKASNQPGWIGPGYNPRMDRPGWFINKGFPPFQTNLLIGRREWRVYQIGPSSFYTNFPVRIYIYIDNIHTYIMWGLDWCRAPPNNFESLFNVCFLGIGVWIKNYQLICNWFQFTFNWFQFTFNWFPIDFNLLSIDFNLLSIDFNLLSIDFQ